MQQVSADVELPIDTSMYVEPKEESKDDVQYPTGSTIITIDESGTIRNMESGIKNLAIIDNFDASNNLGSKIPSSIASVNSRTDSTNNNLDTLNTTEANRDIKEMAIGLQNREEQEIKDIFNLTKIKNTQKIKDTKPHPKRNRNTLPRRERIGRNINHQEINCLKAKRINTQVMKNYANSHWT